MKTTNNTQTQKSFKPFENLRDAMLSMYEIGDEGCDSVFTYAGRLMVSLSCKVITDEQYTLLSGSLQNYCRNNKIDTAIWIDGRKVCDLF